MHYKSKESITVWSLKWLNIWVTLELEQLPWTQLKVSLEVKKLLTLVLQLVFQSDLKLWVES